MAEVKWIKIVTDIFDDEKILFIEQLPEADSIIVIWFKLLTLAGKINNGGVMLFRDNIPYTDEMLATIFRRPINTVRLALKTFEEFGMVEIINNAITIPNWSKHQSLDQLEERKEYMREYMRKYREKQKQLAEGKVNSKAKSKINSKVNSKANVNSLEREEEVEGDIEREEDIKDISLQINNLRGRYSDNELSVIDNYFDILRWTRKNGKIADSVILKIYTEWEKYSIPKVIYALKVYTENPKHHDKKENYCYGIMRNATAEEIENKKTNSNKSSKLELDHNYDMDHIEKMILKRNRGG